MQPKILLERLFKFLSSFKLAVIIMAALGIMSAIGTITEARFDAEYARKMVYESPLMYAILALLCVCLFNVMLDRLPWKRHHLGFILAHIGIIMLCVGALITRYKGVDGSITFGIGQSNRYVSLNDYEMAVFATFADSQPIAVKGGPVDFLRHPPSKEPFEWAIGKKTLKVKDYYNYAIREQKVVPSTEPSAGPAIRIQLQNARVNLTEWVNKPSASPFESFDLGPARIVLADQKTAYNHQDGNEIVIRPTGKEDELSYDIYTKSKGGKTGHGLIHMADVIETGWMGLQLRVLKYLPKAEQRIEYIKRDSPTGITTSAVLISYGDDKSSEEHWIGLNSTVRFFAENTVYFVTYRNRMLDLGFDLHLDNFVVGHYQGTTRAMSYQSQVTVPNVGSVKIYMNNPLKYQGYTFYQASFQEDNKGNPTTSILSVNKDPGRPLKYLGSLLIVLGSIVMFWFKQYRMKIFAKVAGTPQQESA